MMTIRQQISASLAKAPATISALKEAGQDTSLFEVCTAILRDRFENAPAYALDTTNKHVWRNYLDSTK